nr:immunoglobulin light chain junction region [Macaca mulatta]
CQQYNNWNRSF